MLLGTRKCGLEVLGSAHLESLKRHSQSLGRHLGVFPIDGMARDQGIPQHANPRKSWDDLLQQLQPLPGDRFTVLAQSRHIPTGTRQAANQAEPYRVRRHHDDGDGLGSILGRQCCGGARCHQDVHIETDKLGH